MEISQLEAVLNRYEELSAGLSDPSLLADRDRYLRVVKEQAGLTEIVGVIRDYIAKKDELAENLAMLQETDDEEMRLLLKEEIRDLKVKLPELEEKLQILLLPKDPRDEKNVYLEIRGGAGGEEAALFAEVLFRMYQSYAESKHFKVEIVEWNATELGGLKEVVCSIQGSGAYSLFKYESGVHRVQRVPVTESGGRIHTSTVTVAVLPEVDEVDVEILLGDITIDTYRSSGAGGQHVNKTDSAIRITHIPTGIVVTCQDQRSQYKNKDRAMAVLRAKLYERAQEERAGSIAEARRDQVGTGDRSERIRTYNYPQGRVTDHRIGLTVYKIDEILAGNLDLIIEPLMRAERTKLLAKGDGKDEDSVSET